MVLPILQYGHPVLRQKGSRIGVVTPDLQALIGDMLETMRQANGVGLAAQQVGRPVLLTVVDIRPVEDRPSRLEMGGAPVDPAAHMPLVLINPEVKPEGPPATGPEGCLSFPEVFADISRPESVRVTALDAAGRRIEFRCGGLLAKVIQHEHDHLQGVLFIDRMTEEDRAELRAALEALQAKTRESLKVQPQKR